MALFCNFSISIPYLNSNKYIAVKTPFSSNFILNTPKVSNFESFSKYYSCSASSSSFTEPNHAQSSTSIIFIKGLPLSTSEGRLEMAFASYGDVTRVKLICDKKTREPLGFAYIWFGSPASALTAVKEMNGEFFDGRFISVMIARPGACMARPRTSPFKF